MRCQRLRRRNRCFKRRQRQLLHQKYLRRSLRLRQPVECSRKSDLRRSSVYRLRSCWVASNTYLSSNGTESVHLSCHYRRASVCSGRSVKSDSSPPAQPRSTKPHAARPLTRASKTRRSSSRSPTRNRATSPSRSRSSAAHRRHLSLQQVRQHTNTQNTTTSTSISPRKTKPPHAPSARSSARTTTPNPPPVGILPEQQQQQQQQHQNPHPPSVPLLYLK